MKHESKWNRGITEWIEDRTLYLSVPFTWLLPEAVERARQRSMFWDRAVAGGPAVALMPHYLQEYAEIMSVGSEYPGGVLQRVNPMATRTTVGCPNKCPFCAVPHTEGKFAELADWPDLPIVADNNLLAASQKHLDWVFDRLEEWTGADFQGIDVFRLTAYHAERFKRLKRPIIRIALDHWSGKAAWQKAYETLREHRVAKSSIRSYVLIGHESDPADAWERCKWVEKHGVKALPMWFHELDAMESNVVTERQQELGWTDYQRRRIMQWFYQHKEAKA